MPIADIKQFISLSQGGTSSLPEQRRLLQEHKVHIDEKIKFFQSFAEKVEHKIAYFASLEEKAGIEERECTQAGEA
ncbi:hypothetical protein D3C73_844960 [compost metagenome]